MDQQFSVVAVDVTKEGAEIAALIRQSFAGVADMLGLTRENCPTHVAFLPEEKLLVPLLQPGARCLGIRGNGRWVGFVAVAPYRDSYEITRLAVSPEHRHKGYGKALLDAACAAARAIGLDEICLGMIEGNTVLKRWYMSQGFVPGEPFRPLGLPYTVCGMSKKL